LEEVRNIIGQINPKLNFFQYNEGLFVCHLLFIPSLRFYSSH
jgi:hypothetical protein